MSKQEARNPARSGFLFVVEWVLTREGCEEGRGETQGHTVYETTNAAVREAESHLAWIIADQMRHERQRIDEAALVLEPEDGAAPFERAVLQEGNFIAGLLPNMDEQEAYNFSVTAEQVAAYANIGEYAMSEGWVWQLELSTRTFMY